MTQLTTRTLQLTN